MVLKATVREATWLRALYWCMGGIRSPNSSKMGLAGDQKMRGPPHPAKIEGLSTRGLCLLAVRGLETMSSLRRMKADRWSKERAWEWFNMHGWKQGMNFIPSTASNQLEMWQPDTWDEPTITRELGWAADLNYNVVRIFLHNLLWESEGQDFLDRVDRFLDIADSFQIKAMIVLFDGCWDPQPRLGRQLPPRPRVHNSRWVQSPGAAILSNFSAHENLRPYVEAVVTQFRTDDRVLLFDLFNEPDNDNQYSYGYEGNRTDAASDAFGTELQPLEKAVAARALMKKTLSWVRELGPMDKPITFAIFGGGVNRSKVQAYRNHTHEWMLRVADVVSFHEYSNVTQLNVTLEPLLSLGRPVICSEYMARPYSTFDPNLGFMKNQSVWAINWGFVSGKSQTRYGWDSWGTLYDDEPLVWFHDVLLANGTPYRSAEAEYLLKLSHSKVNDPVSLYYGLLLVTALVPLIIVGGLAWRRRRRKFLEGSPIPQDMDGVEAVKRSFHVTYP